MLYKQIDKDTVELLDLTYLLVSSYKLFELTDHISTLYRKLASVLPQDDFVIIVNSQDTFYRYSFKPGIGELHDLHLTEQQFPILRKLYTQAKNDHLLSSIKMCIINFKTQDQMLLVKTMLGL